MGLTSDPARPTNGVASPAGGCSSYDCGGKTTLVLASCCRRVDGQSPNPKCVVENLRLDLDTQKVRLSMYSRHL
jgi:hypothetical protein